VSGRLGYVTGPLMLYAKGGAAWMNADYRLEVNSGIDGATVLSANRSGWNAGVGLEYMLGLAGRQSSSMIISISAAAPWDL